MAMVTSCLLLLSTDRPLCEEVIATGPWLLAADDVWKARLSVDPKNPGSAAVLIDEKAEGSGGLLNLYRGEIPIQKELSYAAKFSARADRPRSVQVALNQGHPPWQPLAVTTQLSLTPEWRTFRVLFQSQMDEPNAQMLIQLAPTAIGVEVRDFEFVQLDPAAKDEDSLRFPPGVWQTATAADATAKVVDTGPDSFRVELGSPATMEDWHVMVWTGGFPLQADIRYSLRFRARADADRVIGIGIDENHPSWRSLGLRKSVVLTPEWKERAIEFVSPRADMNARLQLRLGGSDSAVEIADVRIARAGSEWNASGIASIVLTAAACAAGLVGFAYVLFSRTRRISRSHATARTETG